MVSIIISGIFELGYETYAVKYQTYYQGLHQVIGKCHLPHGLKKPEQPAEPARFIKQHDEA